MARHTPRHAGPARVVVLGGGRHALDHARDPRVVVQALDDPTPPDIVMLSSAISEAYERGKADLTPDIVQRLQSGRATLVFDASGEGPTFDGERAKTFHHLLRDLQVPAGQAAYLTQNRDYAPAYDAWRQGQITPFEVIPHDYYLSRFFREHEADGQATYKARLKRFRKRGSERRRRYVCLNFSPRTAKVLLLLALVKDGLWRQGFISFPGFDETAHIRAVRKAAMAHDLAILPGLEGAAAELLPWLDALEAKGAALLGVAPGERQHVKALANDMELREYHRAWFTIVTETEVMGTRRVTEKPFKALANFSPLILWGNPGSLDLLRGWDFETFGAMFDESYDDEADPQRRFDIVREEIRRLCAAPEADLARMEAGMADVLAHNARRALVDLPRIYRDRVEPELVDRLLDLRRTG